MRAGGYSDIVVDLRIWNDSMDVENQPPVTPSPNGRPFQLAGESMQVSLCVQNPSFTIRS